MQVSYPPNRIKMMSVFEVCKDVVIPQDRNEIVLEEDENGDGQSRNEHPEFIPKLHFDK